MASGVLQTTSSRRNSRSESEKENKSVGNNCYVKVFVKPLNDSDFRFFLSWLGINYANMTTQHLGCLYCAVAAIITFTLYQLFHCDIGFIFGRFCATVVPMFSILCTFFWLALQFRSTWSCISIYLLFFSLFMGEILALVFSPAIRLITESGNVGDENKNSDDGVINSELIYSREPIVILLVLSCVSIASLCSSLDTFQSAVVIFLIGFTRYLACFMMTDLPHRLRIFVGYACGFSGVLVARYMERVLKPPIQQFTSQDGKIPVIKRRRSASSGSHSLSNHYSTRRTSLPALIQKSQASSAGYESAVVGEAHGLITDMLADVNLPSHVVSGLRAISNLLKPPETHGSFHRPRVSPLVSLTETSNVSDNEESPYTGERPSSLPRRFRRSLPPSLLRRMSTSTWTTTTSATGMPTLEPEPCRLRSSSFRHSRDATPGSSPFGSRCTSPSPSTSSTVILTIPKSRSFSLANAPLSVSHALQRRTVRKSFGNEGIRPSLAGSNGLNQTCTDSKSSSDLTRIESQDILPEDTEISEKSQNTLCPVPNEAFYTETSVMETNQQCVARQRLITSDYESSDSPNSSDFNDHLGSVDDTAKMVTRKMECLHLGSGMQCAPHVPVTGADGNGRSVVTRTETSLSGVQVSRRQTSYDVDEVSDTRCIAKASADSHVFSDLHRGSLEGDDSMSSQQSERRTLLFALDDVESCELLDISRLNDWDYPIFKLAEQENLFILSKVAYKLFTEVGLMETFRIPALEFINYFHSLELGYREKPYHNRVHATDVLHGVYYITTRPIPGFNHINTVDMCLNHESESCSRSIPYGASFLTEDSSYGIMGGNIPALELLSLYTAAAMHDYDHPGRTNAFLVATHAPQAILYNDRAVLENHHAAAAWRLLLSDPSNNFLTGLDNAEFKRFRFLVIEAILATDLKRHFEILAEFNAKVNDEQAPGLDWTQETDRLLTMQMVIKMADINGPAKEHQLHYQWTMRIAEEFYEQGDEENVRHMSISPYMDRRMPQLAKLQETFINHLVAPLCNAMVTGGLLPGTWVEESSDVEGDDTEPDFDESTSNDTYDEDADGDQEIAHISQQQKHIRRVDCQLTKNMKDNYEYWVSKMKDEVLGQRASLEMSAGMADPSHLSSYVKDTIGEKVEMGPIKEEMEPGSSTLLHYQLPKEESNSVDLKCVSNTGLPPSDPPVSSAVSARPSIATEPSVSSTTLTANESLVSIGHIATPRPPTSSRPTNEPTLSIRPVTTSGPPISTGPIDNPLPSASSISSTAKEAHLFIGPNTATGPPISTGPIATTAPPVPTQLSAFSRPPVSNTF